MKLSIKKTEDARKIYFLLGALFIAALITCNIIAFKFVSIEIGPKTFVLSVGVLPYPFTFLVTDILSEIYGRKKTNHVVIVGFIVSIFVLLLLVLGNSFNAIPNSPVSDEVYNTVFQNSWRAILASMTAYLVAQLIDVRLFHFWKKLTKGKHLWIRNNFSTIFSQLVDTILVVTVIFFGQESWNTMGNYILDGWMFKALTALIDTLFIYVIIHFFRKYFKLKQGEEITI